MADEHSWRAVNTDSADLAFREILINKALKGEAVSCTVTQDNFENAVKKLQNSEIDIVLAKGEPESFGPIPSDLTCFKFAQTLLLVFVSKNNPVSKIKISDLTKIWNDDYSSWSVFNKNNPYSIHRYGMRLNDSTFAFIKKNLSLKDNAQHFPLDSAQQIITMTAANPHGIGIAAFENDLDFSNIKLIQLTDDSGKNIKWIMSHTVFCRKKSADDVKQFLNIRKK